MSATRVPKRGMRPSCAASTTPDDANSPTPSTDTTISATGTAAAWPNDAPHTSQPYRGRWAR